MKISHHDFLWLGAITVVIIAAYAINKNATAQAAANATPQLTTSPNYVEAAPAVTVDTGTAGSTSPVFTTVSTPNFNFQVTPVSSSITNLDYQMPTIPTMTNVNNPLAGVNTQITVPSTQTPMQELLDPFGIFS